MRPIVSSAWRPPTPITSLPLLPMRAVVWAVARGDLDVEALVLGLYRCAWAEAGDISTPDAVADVAASIGFDRAALHAGIECPETKAGLQSIVADAVARGFFGSPFIIVDGEPFWGADRLPMVERWLVSPW
jgi:2-hydroxychromene-2-carboxylate isomerase